MPHLLYSLVLLAFLSACTCEPTPEASKAETAKKEILQVEADFAKMALDSGVPAAFLAYTAEDAVIMQGKTLLKGRTAIHAHFSNPALRDLKLEWSPDFVDAAASGEMGYTYGPYTFSALDSAGNVLSDKGYFHTVWKKQEDGSWKFVWD